MLTGAFEVSDAQMAALTDPRPDATRPCPECESPMPGPWPYDICSLGCAVKRIAKRDARIAALEASEERLETTLRALVVG
jgi:hypothetical protein